MKAPGLLWLFVGLQNHCKTVVIIYQYDYNNNNDDDDDNKYIQ